MEVGRGVRRQLRREHPYERNHRRAGVTRVPHELDEVEAGWVACRGDRLGRRRRHDPHLGLGGRERGLYVKHGLEPSPLRRGVRDMVGNEEAVEGGAVAH